MKRIIAVNSNCYRRLYHRGSDSGSPQKRASTIELTATKGWTEHVFPICPLSGCFCHSGSASPNELIPFSMSGHCNLMDPKRIPDF